MLHVCQNVLLVALRRSGWISAGLRGGPTCAPGHVFVETCPDRPHFDSPALLQALVTSLGIKSLYNPYDNPNIPPFNVTRDLSGGFYEDGPWGPMKNTKSIALATSLLAWAMLDGEDAFRADADTTVRRSFFLLQRTCKFLAIAVPEITCVRPACPSAAVSHNRHA
jgi:hypothetical protein